MMIITIVLLRIVKLLQKSIPREYVLINHVAVHSGCPLLRTTLNPGLKTLKFHQLLPVSLSVHFPFVLYALW